MPTRFLSATVSDEQHVIYLQIIALTPGRISISIYHDFYLFARSSSPLYADGDALVL